MIIELSKKRIEKLKYKNGLTNMQIEILVSLLASLERFARVKIEHIVGDEKTIHIFENDKRKFELVFCSMCAHWEIIDLLKKEEFPKNNEFEMYKTLEDLYDFFDKKVKQKLEEKRIV